MGEYDSSLIRIHESTICHFLYDKGLEEEFYYYLAQADRKEFQNAINEHCDENREFG